MRKFLLVLLLWGLSLSASCADSSSHWIEVRTPHFTVLTDSDARQATRLASQFEQMRAVFHTVFPNASDGHSPIVVVAVRNKKEFQALEPEVYLAKGQLDLAGYFLSARDKNLIMLRLDVEGEHPFAVIYHEYTHFMTRKATWMPLWMTEGLAEFYQNTDINEKEVLLGQPSRDDILYLQQNRLLPLTTLLTVDHSSPYYHDEQKGSVFYAQSWALTHFLEVTDNERHTTRLQEYALLVSQNVDSVTAAEKAFGNLKQLEKSLDAYIRSYNFKMFKMNTGVSVDASTFQQRSIPQAEADAVRAEILIRNDRLKDAGDLLDATLRSAPGNATAEESMGLLKLRENDLAEAKRWYGEAVKGEPKDWLAQFNYALTSLQLGGHDDEAIESSLHAAINLNPKFAPSYDTLAMFYATRDKDLAEAHRMNVIAIQLEPENVAYRVNAAAVLSQQRQYLSAVKVLKAARQATTVPDQVALIESRIHQLEEFQAQSERAAAEPAVVERPIATKALATPASLSSGTTSMVFRRVDGRVVGLREEMPHYPTGEATGPRHKVQGILRDVRCSDSAVLALSVDDGKHPVTLYINDYSRIAFTATNFDSSDEIKPCLNIEGMKAVVEYAEVVDKAATGQIVSIELSK